MVELTEFCRRVTAICPDEEIWYIRIRGGSMRKSASVIASGIQCTGVQPMTLEREIEERIRAAGTAESIWIEALRDGSGQIKDMVKIVPDQEDEIPETGNGLESSVHSLTSALVAITLREQERSERNFAHLMDTQGAFLRAFQEQARLSAQLEFSESGSEMSEAIAMLAPLLPAISDRLRQPKAVEETPESFAKGITPDQHADNLVAAVLDLHEHYPDSITPARMAKLAGIL